MQDDLEAAFDALAAHVDQHGSESYFAGLLKFAAGLGMTYEDRSGGYDIIADWRLARTKRKLRLSYVLAPGDDAPHHSFKLSLRGAGTSTRCREWEYLGNQQVELAVSD